MWYRQQMLSYMFKEQMDHHVSEGDLSSSNVCSLSFSFFFCFFLTKQTLVKLDECRAALGQVIDRWKVLQSEPDFGATVGPVGGALELRWQSASMRAEREVQRCSDIQDSQLRWDWLQICMHGISFSPSPVMAWKRSVCPS